MNNYEKKLQNKSYKEKFEKNLALISSAHIHKEILETVIELQAGLVTQQFIDGR